MICVTLNVRKSAQLLIQQIFPVHHSWNTRGLGHSDPGCSNRFIYPMFNMMHSMPVGLVFTCMSNAFYV